MTEVIDYRALLQKYMRHVKQCEGIDFVDHIGDGWYPSEVIFTEQERAIMDAMSEKIAADLWAAD